MAEPSATNHRLVQSNQPSMVLRTSIPLLGLMMLFASLYLMLSYNSPQDAREMLGGSDSHEMRMRAFNISHQSLVCEESSLSKVQDFQHYQMNRTCEPKTNVFYLKVHKTGSSTLTLMMYRLARKYHLNVLPVNTSPHRAKISQLMMKPPPDVAEAHPYNIFAEHYYYKEDDVMALMPPDTVHVASIRAPLSQMRAVMIEFGHVAKFNRSDPDPIRTYLQNITKWGPLGLSSTKSLQMDEFGLSTSQLDKMAAVRQHIKYINRRFDMVVVSEYFDESLILLKRKLCWETDDILYMVLRARNYIHKNNVLELELQEKHRQFSKADYAMYDFFVDKLFKEISHESGFWDELERFKLILHEMDRFCEPILKSLLINIDSVRALADSDVNITIDARPWGRQFTMHGLECAIMRLDTTVLRNCLKVLLYPELCTSPRIKRVWNDAKLAVTFDIAWAKPKSNTLNIHPLYCSPVHPKHNIQIDILAQKQLYMGLNIV